MKDILPDDYTTSYDKIVPLTHGPIYPTKGDSSYHCLFLKDPIGKIYYSDPSERHLYRDNAAESAFNWYHVKSEIIRTYENLKNSKSP